MLFIALFLLISVVLLRLSVVQTYFGKIATNQLNKTYDTNVVVKKVDLSFLGSVKLKQIDIKDHHKDSLIFIESLTTSVFSYKNIMDNKLELGTVDMDGVILNMVTHEGESNDNLSVFVSKFDSEKERDPSIPPFLLTSSQLNLSNSKFVLYDKNKNNTPIVFYENMNGAIEDFKIEGPNVYAKIRGLGFYENHGITVIDLTTDFSYTKENMTLSATKLKTKGSQIVGDIVFKYSNGKLSDFNNKVQIVANFDKSSITLNDLSKFYSEFGKNDIIHFTSKLTGTLNDFKLHQLKLRSNRNSIINGNFHFKNAINNENGFSLNAQISNLASNYQNLKLLLPNILGKTLPSSFDKFGRFSIKGTSFVTSEMVDAKLEMNSVWGTTLTDLQLTNIDDIDNANYKGNVEFIDLDLGRMINDSLVGKLSLIADVEGKGFTLETLKTKVKGNVSKHQYKGYTYSNIDVNGIFENQLFNGELNANDENLKMKFKGLADLSSAIYKFNFVADVSYAEFNKLDLFKRDEKAILKGKMNINLVGNSLDNMSGAIVFRNASYENQNDNYYFRDFNINSRFIDTTRVIKINSPDIINGTLKGRFKFEELEKLAKNSLGSIYTDFEPKNVTPGQFLDFNFKINNKIIEVFFPEVKLGSNTSIKGKIIADKEKFELTFRSPEVEAYKNIAKNIRLQIDNKNPLYNTLLSIDEVNTKYYNISDMNLVNVTLNDTLFFRTDFFGGRNMDEKFDLSFYHTLNENNKSVVGLKKSDIKFKDNDWLVNPTNNRQNKVVFDEKFQTFAFDKINIISKNQEIDFAGVFTGKNDKDVTLNLKNVKLEGITPKVDSLDIKGLVNGYINYKQIKGTPLPLADLIVNDLHFNDVNQGDLIVNALGDNSLRKYIIDVSLENERVKSIEARGEIDFEAKNPTVFANFSLNKYSLEPFNPLGKGVIDNIRGDISGKGVITGLLSNPDFDGDLQLINAGIAIPYLNVDYDFIGVSKIALSKQRFRFLPTALVDVVHDTEATLLGDISHTRFTDWYLDLKINTDNFLVLNTTENEEIPYYGNIFIGSDVNGEKANASIKGYTDALVIDATATTKKGTEFIIPLSDVNTVGNSKLINFISKTKKGVDENIVDEIIFDQVKGLTLNFFLEVTNDAEVEIVVDKNTGSILRGRGAAFLDIAINTNGRFEIEGTYVVTDGIYEFRNIVNKDFIVQPGGTVSWEGSPFDAYLNNITAIYRTKANPATLLDNVTSREIDIDLVAKISGQLLNSEIEFDLEIPNSNSLVNSELAFKLSDEDKKMTQFFSLLTTGSFINLDEGNLNFDGNAALTGTISEKISDILSSILKSKGDIFDVGVTYAPGQRGNSFNTSLVTDDQLGLTFKGRIGKKVIYNGKVGVPVGGNTQASVIGEVELELPLNEAETFRAKVYNKQNEIQFTVANEEGYTQGIGLSYRVDFDSGKELKEKIFGNKKLKKKKISKDSLKEKNSLVNFTKIEKGNATSSLTVGNTQTGGPSSVTMTGDVLDYTIVITNTGTKNQNNAVTTITLPDGSVGVLNKVTESITANNVLEVGETWTYTISYSVTKVQIEAGKDLINKVSVVTAEVPGPTVDTVITPIIGKNTKP